SVWLFSDGTPLSDSYFSKGKPLPPLAPRVQFSPSKAPVAGYVGQIERVVADMSPCRANASENVKNYKQMVVGVDERGVALSLYNASATPHLDAMVLADMNLSNASITRYSGGGNFSDECWIIEITCKSGVYQYCGEHNTDLAHGTQSSTFNVYTNTRDQA